MIKCPKCGLPAKYATQDEIVCTVLRLDPPGNDEMEGDLDEMETKDVVSETIFECKNKHSWGRDPNSEVDTP